MPATEQFVVTVDHASLAALKVAAVVPRLRALGIMVSVYMKHLCPVDTGQLRASIGSDHTSEPGAVLIGVTDSNDARTDGTVLNRDVALFNEFGTMHMRGTVFMVPSLDAARSAP